MIRMLRSPASYAVLAAMMVACKSTTTPPTPVPTSIAVSSPTVSFDALGATETVTATVKDQDGAVMTGQTVTWSSADASIASASSGTITAVNNGSTTVTATSGSLTADVSVTVEQVTTLLAKISGDAQNGVVGDTLADSIVVEQRDSSGHPVPGGTGGKVANSMIHFTVATGGGSVAEATVTPGADGRAATRWVLGTAPGAQSVTATTAVSTVAGVTFTATAAAGAADTLAMVSGDSQTAAQGTAVADSLVVRVADRYGNPVTGHTVTFSTGDGGSMSPATVATDVNGHAATQWTLGSTPGSQSALAQAETPITGSPVTFGATAITLAIVAVTPDTLVEGGSATITGTGFDPAPANNAVVIDGAVAVVNSASSTSLTVTVPTYDCRPSRAGNVQVSVGGANSNVVPQPLNPATFVSLAVGEQQIVQDPANFCFQFPSSPTGGEAYVIGVGAASETFSATQPFTLFATAGLSPAPPMTSLLHLVPSIAAADGPITGERPDEQGRLAAHRRSEGLLRAWEREYLPAMRMTAPSSNRMTMSVEGTQSVPNVGDTLTIKVPTSLSDPCNTFATIKAVVRKVGADGVWVTDTNNPTSTPLTDADIAAYSDTFDVNIFPTDTLYFGTTGDRDANQRVIVVLTIEVNKISPGPGLITEGFVFGGDLYPVANCAQSNFGELFYGQVPDPNNVSGTGARSKAFVLDQMPSLVAHEFSHDIQQSRRYGAANMASWVAEGQATFAEEVVGHSVLGNSPAQNYGSSVALTGQGPRWYEFDKLAHYFGDLGVSTTAANAPDQCSLFSGQFGPCPGDDYYGASWSFQRYVADRFGPSYPGGEVGLSRDIIGKNPTLAGAANIQATVGVDFDSLFAAWAAMLYADDRVSNPLVSMTSWNLLDIYTAYGHAATPLKPVDRSFVTFSDARAVRGGGVAYTRISSAPGARAALAVKVRDSGGGVLGTALAPQVWVLRTQ